MLNELKAIDQSKLNGKPSYARQIKKEDYLIDWKQNARKVIKKIQGLYPNAYTIYMGKRIKIIEACVIEINKQKPEKKIIDIISLKKRFPGEIIILNKKDGIAIMTNDYPILIKIGQLEGKKKTDGYTLSIQANLNINKTIGA